jgi:hypothetical protein
MSLWVVDIHGDIEGDYDLVTKYNKNLNCINCIKYGTDACPRGASRGDDDEICGEYYEENKQ